MTLDKFPGLFLEYQDDDKQTEYLLLSVILNNIVLSSGVKSLSRVRFFVTPWTVAYQAPTSMGFSRQQYWNGLPFPSSSIVLGI